MQRNVQFVSVLFHESQQMETKFLSRHRIIKHPRNFSQTPFPKSPPLQPKKPLRFWFFHRRWVLSVLGGLISGIKHLLWWKLFNSAWRPWEPSTLLHASAADSFLSLNSIPFYVYPPALLCILLLMNTWAISSLGILGIELICNFYTRVFVYVCIFLE